jgi:hypothetical protein
MKTIIFCYHTYISKSNVGITSKYTSFIAVNETEKSDKGSWGVQTRYVQQDYEDDEDFNPTSPQQRRRCAPRRLLATRAGRGGSGGCGGFSFTPTPVRMLSSTKPKIQ